MRKFFQNNFTIICIGLLISLVISLLLVIGSGLIIKSYPSFYLSFMKIVNLGAAWSILLGMIALSWLMLLSLESEDGICCKIFSYIFKVFKFSKNKKLLAELDAKDLTNINSGLSVTVTAQNSGSNVITAGSPMVWSNLANPNAVISKAPNVPKTFLEKYCRVRSFIIIADQELDSLYVELRDIARGFSENGSPIPDDIRELHDFLNDFILDISSIVEKMNYQYPNAKNISDNNL